MSELYVTKQNIAGQLDGTTKRPKYQALANSNLERTLFKDVKETIMLNGSNMPN